MIMINKTTKLEEAIRLLMLGGNDGKKIYRRQNFCKK